MRPSSGVTIPARIFIRVDLPAPFSPIKAWTVPGRTFSPTSFSALTPGKLLLIPDISRAYSLIAHLSLSGRPNGGWRWPGRVPCHRPATATRSLALEVRQVGRRHQLVGDVDVTRHGVAVVELHRGVDATGALALGVLEDRDLEVAGLHRRERVAGGVHAADQGLVQLVGRLER